MIKLVDKTDTYELVWEQSDEPKEKWAVFTLKKLTAGEVNSMEDQLTAMGSDKGDRKLYFLSGTSRRLKIKYALVDWKHVTLDGINDVPCTDVNKDKLPAEVQIWLEDNIDEVNGLKGIREEKRKNS